MSADIGCGRTMDAVPSVIVASVCINPRLAADRPLRACPARPRAKTGPRMRVSAASRQVHEFVHGDEACAFGSFGTELDRRFVQTYRQGIAVARTQPYPFAHPPAEEIEHGVPLFLTQLADTLRLETTAEPFSSEAVGATGSMARSCWQRASMSHRSFTTTATSARPSRRS